MSEKQSWISASPSWGQLFVLVIGVAAAAFMVCQARIKNLEDTNAILMASNNTISHNQEVLASNQEQLGNVFNAIMHILSKDPPLLYRGRK